MTQCNKCRSSASCERPWKGMDGYLNCVSFDPAMTNGDKMRAMTDEELDKFLGEVQWDVANYCGGVTQKQEYPVPEQRGAWLDWLKQEVKEGE